MLVNEELGFAFTHLQKCGGNTIKNYLLGIPGTKYVTPKPHYCHSCVADMPEYSDLFNFATIRNPLSWYLSMYQFSKRGQNQERWIFGDVNKIPFTDWLANALHPRITLRNTDVWNSEIGFEVPKEYITTGSLDAGWMTYRYLYGVAGRHKDLFRSAGANDLIYDYHKYVDLDCLIKLEAMDEVFHTVLEENTECNGLKSIGMNTRLNTTSYNKKIASWYSDEDIHNLMNQDYLFFAHHYNYPDEEEKSNVWYRGKYDNNTDKNKKDSRPGPKFISGY